MSEVRFADANSGRLLSPAIWKNLPRASIQSQDRAGTYFFDDFKQYNARKLGVLLVGNGYAGLADTGGTITKGTSADGELVFTTDTSDDDEVILGISSGVAVEDGGTAFATSDEGGSSQVQMTLPSSSSAYLTCFECRVKLGTITAQEFFIGLTEAGMVKADTLYGGTGGIATKSLIGFSVVEATPSVIGFRWGNNGQTGVLNVATAQTAVAATYYKLGFCFDPVNNVLRAFVDGVEVGETALTSITSTTFPSGDALALLMYAANRSGAARTWTLDWWAVGQVEA